MSLNYEDNTPATVNGTFKNLRDLKIPFSYETGVVVNSSSEIVPGLYTDKTGRINLVGSIKVTAATPTANMKLVSITDGDFKLSKTSSTIRVGVVGDNAGTAQAALLDIKPGGIYAVGTPTTNDVYHLTGLVYFIDEIVNGD